MKRILTLFIFCFSSFLSFSQGEFLIEIDTATGSFSHIGTAIKGIHFVYPYIRGYDETHGAYIFQGGNPVADSLYSINTTNGSIISSPYFSPSGTGAREPKYDNIKDTLYGLYWNNSLSEFFLAWINPVTGLYTQIGTTPIAGLSGVSQGATAYDEINHRYFALDNTQLFCIDATNGSLISSPTLSSSPSGQLIHFWYDNSTNTLYGLMQTIGITPQLCYLVSINTTTGVMTTIGSGTTFGSGGGSSAINRTNRRYMYTYTTGGSSFYIVTLDIATGNVIANKLLPLCTGDNIHSITFDNVKGKLYGIQWDADTTLGPLTVNSPTICVGDTATLIASGANTYTWNTGATTATITASPTVTTTYTVAGTGTNNCVDTITASIIVNNLPPVTAHLTSTFTPICSGDSITLSEAGANTYTWTSTSYTFTASDTVANGVKFPPKVGIDTFTVKGKDTITGCVNTATISVLVKPSPNILVTPASGTICPGGSVSFTVSGAGVTSYTWSPTTNLSPSANSTSITVSPTVSTSYQVMGMDTNGCMGGNEAIVIIPQDSIYVNSHSICQSNSVALNASSIPMNYTWSPATGLSSTSGSSVIANPRNTTVYTIAGTDNYGCHGTTTATVTVNSLPTFSISNTPTKPCSGNPDVLMASGASTYTWSIGTVGAITTVFPTTITKYIVTGTDTNGCSNSDTLLVLVNPLPTVTINSGVTSFTLNLGQSITLNASGALIYSWTSGNVTCDSCASNTASPIASTQYCVAGSDINGCRDSTCLQVVVEDVCDVFIPDAFSPNGDGHNDKFKVYGHCITELTLQIFDRWGNLVFSGSDPSAAWDGSYGGNLMNTGTYVYQVQYTLSNGEKTKTKGNVSLMR